MELKNVDLLGFYALMRNWPRFHEMVWDAIETGHKMKIKTRIEEPLSPLDSWHRISSRGPLTLGCHVSEVALLIDFEN